jgi:hypothetical protein
MKNFLLSIALAGTFIAANAQNYKYCGTDEAMKDWFDKNPEARLHYEKLMQEAKETDAIAFRNGYGSQNKVAAPVYTVPVVFHVLHLGGIENISDAQINDAVNILTRDYNKQNADTSAVISQFKNLIGDVKFEFRLATKDPSGNCTNGIVRHNDTRTDWTSSVSDYIYTWPPNKYLNVYVVRSIASGAAGYTYLPGTGPSTAADCIVILHDYVGSIGTGNVGTSRALTHEVGHWFNLPHVWGGTNQPGVACGDEGVSDTPVTKGYSSCPSSTTAAMICNAGVVENYQNYMDYSYCSRMFTTGQASRMTTAINSATGGRNNLSTVSNLTATGIISPNSNCAPIADFHTFSGNTYNLYTICAGQALSFVDDSYNGTVTSRLWATNSGGTLSAPTSTLTSISFPAAGTWTVTLASGNSTGTTTATKTIVAIPTVANYPTLYQESFEYTASTAPANWTVINQTGGVTWQKNTSAASTGTASFYMNNTINPNNAIDILETGSYDFAANPGATYTFKYAYAQKTSSYADVFIVQASKDCGGSWNNIYTPSSSVLASGSGGVMSTAFVPTPSQFKTYTLTSHPAFTTYKSQSNVRIRFYFKSDPGAGFGNNFYLDDINFNTPLGVNELTKSIELSLYPNPTEGTATLDFNLDDPAQIRYSVLDITGREVEESRTLGLEPGRHSFDVNASHKLTAGIYFVNLELNGQKMSRKLIIE